MKPHPRIRKTIKWGGAAVTLLLVVVWIGSGTAFNLEWIGADGYSVNLAGGRLNLHRFGFGIPQSLVGFKAHWTSANRLLLWLDVVQTKGHQAIAIPLWMLAVGTCAVTSMFWHLDTLARRRARAGRCPNCNYDRTGLAADAVCPECGKLPTP